MALGQLPTLAISPVARAAGDLDRAYRTIAVGIVGALSLLSLVGGIWIAIVASGSRVTGLVQAGLALVPGMLPAIMRVAPNSPRLRAKASRVPANTPGHAAGRITRP